MATVAQQVRVSERHGVGGCPPSCFRGMCSTPLSSAGGQRAFSRGSANWMTDPERGDGAMRRVLLGAVLAGTFLFGLGGVAFATPTPNGVTHPGQHNMSCGPDGPAPGGGNSVNSPGSPF